LPTTPLRRRREKTDEASIEVCLSLNSQLSVILTYNVGRNLNPGGWLEMHELSIPVANDDGTMTPEHAVYKWTHYMLQSSKIVGQSLDNPPKYARWMRETGFVNVQHYVFKWPSNPWPKDDKHKLLGMWTLANILDGIEGFTMAMFTRVLGWQPAEVQRFLVDVRKDARDKSIHNYYNV
jgi:hypothetical protein